MIFVKCCHEFQYLFSFSTLERCLDAKLREEEKNHPLVPPSPSLYEFAVEDSDENIIFEENQESSYESPLIKVIIYAAQFPSRDGCLKRF